MVNFLVPVECEAYEAGTYRVHGYGVQYLEGGVKMLKVFASASLATEFINNK